MNSLLDEIIEEQEEKNKSDDSSNSSSIGSALHYVGIAFIGLGLLAGVIVIALLKDPDSGTYFPDPHPLRWLYGIGIIISTSISGLLFMGFSEVIKLLISIRDNTKSK
ncbi:hypothetical protein [Paenibacillus macerans]|uniref:hypothetical protein n=1 Tax=Paenibacillus macerans TaxID=44252 RepID=UPI002041A533|nr:hypothetical protein [Paenibacillus macerans]MCM3699263.1 hypothetical protein [Paenibacillus macerans]